jgi:hypothetical protein
MSKTLQKTIGKLLQYNSLRSFYILLLQNNLQNVTSICPILASLQSVVALWLMDMQLRNLYLLFKTSFPANFSPAPKLVASNNCCL